jgi:hypothetical protein
MTDNKIKSALDAAGTAADYSARATYQRGYDAGVESLTSDRDAAIARAIAAEARESETMRGLDVAIARADAAEAREWVLGVQVVAQAQRLRLADAVVDEARYGQPTLAMRQALAAWDAVPGDAKETT